MTSETSKNTDYEQIISYSMKIKAHKKYNKNFTGGFPNPSELKKKPHLHLPIIVEQIECLLNLLKNNNEKNYYLGILTDRSDLERLINKIEQDFIAFNSIHGHIDLPCLSYEQTTLTGNTLFNLSRSAILKDTYKKHIDMNCQKSVYETFSVPFLLRLAIEKKLKGMIGFKSATTYLSDGNKQESEHFPAARVINFLIKNDLVESKIKFNEIKKIYNWCCSFVHTGNKDYIWMMLKALDCIDKLFYRENNHGQYSGNRIFALKNGIKHSELEKLMNNSIFFNFRKKEKITEEYMLLSLDENEYDEEFGFYDKRNYN